VLHLLTILLLTTISFSQLKAHRNNPLVEKKQEKQPVNKELTSINIETAGQIIQRLQLEEIVDPIHLVELSNEFRVCSHLLVFLILSST
jgi:hypothetical protein